MKHDETILPTSHPKTRRTWHHLLTEATQVPSKPLASEASRGELPGLGSRSVSAEYLPYINLYIYMEMCSWINSLYTCIYRWKYFDEKLMDS